ncbi:EamA family transporter [Nonomuraea sp. NPDC004186]
MFSLLVSAPSSSALGALLVLGVVCTGGTLVLFYTLINRSRPAHAALAFYLSPAFAVVLDVVLLQEQLTPLHRVRPSNSWQRRRTGCEKPEALGSVNFTSRLLLAINV